MAAGANDGSTGEDRLIATYFRPIAKSAAALGLMDDAASLTPPPGHDLVLTADAIVAGVHFFANDPADSVARKALGVNLSDLAAKGARPLGFLLTLALPSGTSDAWLAGFAAAMAQDADAFGCPLLGGDTVRTPGPLMVSVSMIGAVPQGTMVRRAGARTGDRIFVTGTIGDAALGLVAQTSEKLATLTSEHRAALVERYRVPRPRLALAEVLRAHATAAMDVSDGLVGDLAKLCGASGCAAAISAASVPLSAAVRAAVTNDPALIETVLTGGDDYEILCTVPEARVAEFRVAAGRTGVAVTDIGAVMPGTDVVVRGGDGRPMNFRRGSYSHF